MNQTPDEIRRDIERTRAQLSSDVNAAAEKVSPSAVVDRQKDRVKEGLATMKDKIMGSDDAHAGHHGDRPLTDQVQGHLDDAKGAARDAAARIGDQARELGDQAQGVAIDARRRVADAPEAIQRGTRGNPIAAGLVAFGLGLLAASLVPASRAERDAVNTLKDKAEPLVHEASDRARDLAEQAKEPLARAGEELRQVAMDGVANVKDEGAQQGRHLADQARNAAEHVQQA